MTFLYIFIEKEVLVASNETLEILEPAVVVDKCIDIVVVHSRRIIEKRKRIMKMTPDWTVNPNILQTGDVRFFLKDALTKMHIKDIDRYE